MSEQLIIAGFHRSGTSATARLLHRAGLFLGDELLEPLPSNPYGHFEDREVVDLHQRILYGNERTWLVDEPFLPVVTPAHWQKMRQIIERRNTEHALWGFKDPRACLFLMLWKYLIPDMKVLLVYRRFSEVTRSLGQRHSTELFLNRGNQLVHERFWKEPDLALKMWLVHNNALLAFARAYPEDTLALSMEMIRDGFPLVWAIKRRWGFELEDVPVGEAFDPGVVARPAGRQPVSDRRLIGKVEATWRGLEELGRKAEGALVGEEVAVAGR
ncbi:MAG TPA: hypothetical protein VHH10_04130 [Rubrobacteraceae bacterium]|nr:hypothetical protein [Rubrobacteraceae bacterium]